MELPARIINPAREEGGARSRLTGSRLTVALSSRRLIVFVMLASVFTMTAGAITDPDFWWHLRTGQLIFETRAIPRADVFSFTAHGWEWVTHEWLTEVVMFGLYRLAGWGGLVAAFSLVMTAAFWIAYGRAARRGAHTYVACAAALLGALATMPIWGVRPQMFSFLFTSVFLLILDDYARSCDAGRDGASLDRRRALWLLVPLTLVWVNMHGGFALGLGLVVVTGAGVALDELSRGGGEPGKAAAFRRLWSRVRPLCFVFAACVGVVPLNPSGVRLYSYPFETINSQAMQKYIVEWFSPDFHQANAHALALLLFATFAALALSPKRARAGELLLVCVAAYAALRSWRNIPFFALAATPALAEHGWSFIEARARARRDAKGRVAGKMTTAQLAMNVVLLVCLPVALCAAKLASVARAQATVEAEKFPAAAVEFMRGRADAGPAFNSYGWGGYLIWKLYPGRLVFIDGRADVYGDALLEEYLSAESGEKDWRKTLDDHAVRTVMIRPDVPLASLLSEDVAWEKGYEDKQAVIFFRR
ncbi:MAG: hypothetical protein LC785_12040 [Acidobacteria bacterium]|nr:hypothetical protein [Acidobacteriota bacterium]MCA1642651.1 hypothetical protein [Acidobacteriota bacterium]